MTGLVLLDWDNTLVDKSAEVNDHLSEPRLLDVIQSVISQGWIVGLNSDTPLKRLQGWWQMLGMNGPIIAERGAVVWWPDGQEYAVSRATESYTLYRQDVLRHCFDQPGYALFYGDNTRFVGSASTFDSADTALIALDAYRTCSVGLYVRRLINGALSVDLRLTEHLLEVLELLRPPHPLVAPPEQNRVLGFVISNAADATKTNGMRALLEQWTHPDEIIMIGDSIADYLDVAGVRHFAVANAQSAFKRHAEVVAAAPYAQGCIELLARL